MDPKYTGVDVERVASVRGVNMSKPMVPRLNRKPNTQLRDPAPRDLPPALSFLGQPPMLKPIFLVCHEHEERLPFRCPDTAGCLQDDKPISTRLESGQRSGLFCSCPLPLLDVVLILSSETPRQKENYDPFLVNSPYLPSRGDHVVTTAIPPSLSYEIEAWNLLRKCRSRF